MSLFFETRRRHAPQPTEKSLAQQMERLTLRGRKKQVREQNEEEVIYLSANRGLPACHIALGCLRSRRQLYAIKCVHDQLFPVHYNDNFYYGLMARNIVSVIAYAPLSAKYRGGAIDPISGREIIGVSFTRIVPRSNVCPSEIPLNGTPVYDPEQPRDDLEFVGYIMTVGVIEQYRSQSVGRHLLAATQRTLAQKGITRIELDVHVGNEVALRFYIRLGFGVQARRARYYNLNGRAEDALALAHDHLDPSLIRVSSSSSVLPSLSNHKQTSVLHQARKPTTSGAYTYKTLEQKQQQVVPVDLQAACSDMIRFNRVGFVQIPVVTSKK